MLGVAGVKGSEFIFFIAPFDAAAFCMFVFEVKPETAGFTWLFFGFTSGHDFPEPPFRILGHEV